MRMFPVVCVMAATALAACGKDEGTAKLAFERSGDNALTFQPANFKMKLIAAYLTEDIQAGSGSNTGITSRFYENNACAGDLMHCDVSAGTGEDGAPIDKIVTDYFDFGPTANPNAALNAQNNPVEAATYKYVRLEFCKYNAANAPTVQWGGSFSGNAVSGEYRANQCGVDSAELSPPITIEAGDTATITLSYSLLNLVTDTPTGTPGDNCETAGGGTYCFNLPTFTPNATKD